MGTQPAAGWYDDGTGRQRWWDGSRWSEDYIDLRDSRTELHTGAAPVGTGTAGPGWYDDQRGRQRWWDGTRWTASVRYSGSEQEFAGLVIDGRWVHFGDLSQPVGGVAASVDTGDALLRNPAFTRTAVERRLFGPGGPITPRTLNRAVARQLLYVVVSGPGGVWMTPVPAGQDAAARRFAGWVTASAEHYRFG
ncbi:DUF2510 domain-containing protein [Microbacterium sp. NPDC057407]|uniref:DUF2510 domain-containing protein n=1 Tax=Microbacterium sp. NPDC057407 TaxID=3346120 RepID=UPI003672FB29